MLINALCRINRLNEKSQINMNKIRITYLLIFIPVIGFTQINKHSSKIEFDKRGNEIKYELTNYALQLSTGNSFNYFDKTTKKYLGNFKGSTYRLNFFYKNLFIGLDYKPVLKIISEQQDTIYFDHTQYQNNAKVRMYRTDITTGYTINLPYNFSIEPYVGILATSFRIVNKDELDDNFELDKTRGLASGFIINKYIKLRSYGSFIVIYLDNNINYTNLNNFHPYLGNTLFSFEIGLAFKGIFERKTRF